MSALPAFQKSILTVTLHPAVDKAIRLPRLRPNDAARARVERIYGGGKGNNVARALTRLGVPVIAGGFQGGAEGEAVTDLIRAEGIQTAYTTCKAPTRTNLVIHESETGATYAIWEPGQPVTAEEIDALETDIDALLEERVGLCLFCGSGQTPLLAPVFARLVRLAAKRGVPSGVDSSGACLLESVPALPYLLKVNREEMEEAYGAPLPDRPALLNAMHDFVRRGMRMVAVSLGGEGLLITDGKETWQAVLPMENVINTVGCGDALLAGIARGVLRGDPPAEMARWGVACGAANTQVEGAGLIDSDLVERLLPRVLLTRLMEE